VTEKVAVYLVNLIANHPVAIPVALGTFIFATLINHGIKLTWTYTEMPRWARFILGFTEPLALNFYHLGEKIGVVQPHDDVSATAIRAAIAKEEMKP